MTVERTSDFHVFQFDGDGGYCDAKNCAAATAAKDIFESTGRRLSADQVRVQSGVSCVPGRDTPSGGLRIGDVERIVEAHGGNIDFGWDPSSGYTRWSPATLALRAEQGGGAHLLVDYGYLRSPWRADGSTFTGDHSAYAHEYDRRTDTYCWHDPLRKTGIRIPAAELIRCWWPPAGALRGYAGMVRELPDAEPERGGTTDVAIRYAPRITSASRMQLAEGQKLYDAPGGDAVTKMSRTAAPLVLGLTKSPSGRAWRPVVVTTRWSYADDTARRTVLYVPASAGKVVPA